MIAAIILSALGAGVALGVVHALRLALENRARGHSDWAIGLAQDWSLFGAAGFVLVMAALALARAGYL